MYFTFEQAGRKTNLHKDEQSVLKKEMWKSDGEGNIFPNNEFENQKDFLSPVDLKTAISLSFLNPFSFPKGFNLYLNKKSFPSSLQAGK